MGVPAWRFPAPASARPAIRRSRWFRATNSRGRPWRPGGRRASSGGYSDEPTDGLTGSLKRTDDTDSNDCSLIWLTGQFLYRRIQPQEVVAGEASAPSDATARAASAPR